MTGELERPISAGWLALRESADTRARDAAAAMLLPPLLTRLDQTAPRVVDLGAGTGANLRWLAPRLPHPDRQHWMLVDHDPGLLARGPAQATAVRADVTELGRLLAEQDRAERADLVTAAALLDLLDPSQLGAIVEAIIDARVPALFSLTVTGEVGLAPPDPLDAPLAAAFDAHQRRDGRLGPDAARTAARLFRDRGWKVLEVPTPWALDRAEGDATLIEAWLQGRVEAAVEHQPELASTAPGWIARRASTPRATVGHVDLLALPDGPN